MVDLKNELFVQDIVSVDIKLKKELGAFDWSYRRSLFGRGCRSFPIPNSNYAEGQCLTDRK